MTVSYDVTRSVATITLDSPHNRNALSAALVTAFLDHLAAAVRDPTVRCVVLTHTGGTFCSGADLTEMAADGGPALGTTRLLNLLRTIVELPKPVIARIDGHVRAGGIGLVGACDLALAGPASTFAFSEVRLGLAPAIISLTTLPRLSDRAAARYYLTGEAFDAGTAAAIGLVTDAPSGSLDDALSTLVEGLRAASPQGLAATKPLTTQAIRAALAVDAEALVAQSAQLFASDEAREGMQAFRERRPPRWAAV